ncbi:hypothetical protein Tco_0649099 [Tanacetum coccineum]
MNEDYYHEQNPCYDSNSFGFDQSQPPQYTVNHPIFNSQNELLNSSNKLMEQMSTLCDLVGQAIQKKEEEKRIAEEQAGKDRYWRIPICYDDDEDDTIAITPVLPIKETDNSLSMGDKHLDNIPETESDEFIKSSVEDLVQIPSESEGIPDKMCDVPLCEDTTPLNALNEHSEIIINSNDDNPSSDSLEVVENIDPEVERIDDEYIFLTFFFPHLLPSPFVKDDTLREKLLNINLLIAKIDALRDNPTPSSDVVTKSDLYHEEFADELAHIMSLPNLECFKFKIEPDLGELTSIDLGIRKDVSTTNVNVPLEDDQSSLFAYVVWIFLAFLTYPVVPPYLLSTGNEDTIFDPGIPIYLSFMPDVSHRNGTFMKFNVYPNRLNESPMMILPSTCFPMVQ